MKTTAHFRSVKDMNSRNAKQKFRVRDFESAKALSSKLGNNRLISMQDARASQKSSINV